MKKTRTLKVKILTLFLSLISVAFLCVISFTYSRDYISILQSSKGVAERSIAVARTEFETLALASEQMTKISAGFFPEIGELNFQNKALLFYLLNVAKYDMNFINFYVGFPDGSLIGAYRRTGSPLQTFVGQPSRRLPEKTAFFLRYVDRKVTPSLDQWFYLDANFNQIASEVITDSGYNALQRPWYSGAEKAGSLFWTGLYVFSPSLERGISISNPMYNAQGELIGVIGADLTFELISQFLMHQKIGKTGRVLILDESGKIIAPDFSELEKHPAHITPEIVSKIYGHYAVDPVQPAFVVKFHGVEYLAYVAKLPVIFSSNWLMMTVAPLDDFFGQMIKMQKEVIGIIIAILLIAALIVVYFAKKISSPIVILAEEVNKISHLELESNIRVLSNIKEIFLIDSSIAAMRRVVRSFGRYVPKEIIRDLFQKKEEIALGGKEMEVTIFFSDIAGFTSIAETHPIDVIIPLLTEYFDAMTKIILGSHGTIDKFLGDGIMAFWGAPIHFPDHASRACTAALRCNYMLSKLNQRRREAGLPEFETRFGISTGIAIVGNMGTEDRLNYTAIGDVVNTTSRLQEVDKVYHTSIIISEDTYAKLSSEFVARPLDFVAVQGRKEKIRIYELIGRMDAEEEIQATPEQISLCKEFTEAYDSMQRSDPQRAKTLFAAIAQKYPDDYPTQIYLERL